MTSQFGQFCPIALASEVLAQKWMLLVVRELNAGATRFNEIRRGVPRISATLLKQRLTQLEDAGIVARRWVQPDGPDEYVLTKAGTELKQVLSAVGTWGQRWARKIENDDLDPSWLVWAMHRRIDTSMMPNGRTVIAFHFTDAPRNHNLFWFVCKHPQVDICVKPPGFEEDVSVVTDTRTMAEVWRGIRPLRQSISNGRIQVKGRSALQRKFPEWLMLSVFVSAKQRPN
jgi:DNA-binding HxlR family transcriptional regulator|tara:strand:+ start:19952 stop:20638 length:687 start_codon:yes stop_codon:yes gene_type:complete